MKSRSETHLAPIMLLLLGASVLRAPVGAAEPAKTPPRAPSRTSPATEKAQTDQAPAGNAPARKVATDASETDSEPSPASRLEEQLRRVVSCDFQQTPLDEAIAHWEKLTGLAIQVDARALEHVGVGAKSPVTLRLRDVTLRSALRHLLNAHELTTMLVDDTPVVTTPERAESHLRAEVYPVRDLIQFVDLAGETQESAEGLIDLIVATLATNSWDAVGGPGSISEFDGQLVVSQTSDIHERLAQLLAALRKLPRSDIARPAPQTPTPLDDSRQRVAAVLNKPFTLDAHEEPLSKIIADIARQYDINILFDQRELKEVGIDIDAPVSLGVTNVSLHTALTLLCRPLDMGYHVQDEALMLSTRDGARNELFVVVYPVLDLLSLSGAATLYDIAEKQETLRDAIYGAVEPNSWDSVGGEAEIQPYAPRGALVIDQSFEAHQQIAALLAKMRAAQKAQPPASTVARETGETHLTIGYELIYAEATLSEKGEPIRPAPEHIDTRSLATVVQETIDPESWRKTPGVSIHALPDRLLVRHEKRVQREIEFLLHQLGVHFISGTRGAGGAARQEGGRFIDTPPRQGILSGGGVFNPARQ